MDFLRAQCTRIPQITPANLSTSTVLITGANAGLGLEAAREILKSKPQRLILAVRNLERGQAAVQELSAAKDASTLIDVRQLDQASFASIKAFADGLSGQKVDIAILNAGSWSFNWGQTKDGYETDLQVNVLGPALISLLLLPNLRQAAASRAPDAPKPHLSFVNSGLHAMAKFPERSLPAGQMLAALNDQNKYNGQDRYQTSKALNLLWAKELARKTSSDEIIINAPNPGFCKTNLLHGASGIMKYTMKGFGMALGRAPEDGAKCIVDGAMVKGAESHGRYLSEAQVKDEVEFIRGNGGAELQKKTWDEVLGVFRKEGVLPKGAEYL